MNAKGSFDGCKPGVAIAEEREQFDHVVKAYPAMSLACACFFSMALSSSLLGGSVVGLSAVLGLYAAYVTLACIAAVHLAKASGTRPGLAVFYALVSSVVPCMPLLFMVGVISRLNKRAKEFGAKPGFFGLTEFEKAEVERGFALMEKRWQETMRAKVPVEEWGSPARRDGDGQIPPVQF